MSLVVSSDVKWDSCHIDPNGSETTQNSRNGKRQSTWENRGCKRKDHPVWTLLKVLLALSYLFIFDLRPTAPGLFQTILEVVSWARNNIRRSKGDKWQVHIQSSSRPNNIYLLNLSLIAIQCLRSDGLNHPKAKHKVNEVFKNHLQQNIEFVKYIFH